MRIGIIGAGGIGGYLAARLTDAGSPVALMARGATLAALRDRGLRLIDPEGDLSVRPDALSDDPAILEGAELVIFAVKAHQMPAAIAQAQPHIGAETRVLPFQNGVDAPDLLADAFGPDRALIGVAQIFANITGPGEITRYGAIRSFQIGTLDGGQTAPPVPEIRAAFRAAGIDAPDMDDLRTALWMKFLLFNAASGTTAGARTTFGEVRRQPETRLLAERLIAEAAAVARATGIPIPDAAETIILKRFNKLPGEGRTSTAHDLAHGRALESDWIAGAVSRRGRALGVATPVSDTIAAVLAPWKEGR